MKIYFLILIILVLFSCKKDTPSQPLTGEQETEMLVKYLEGVDGGFINTSVPAFISAKDLRTQFLSDTTSANLHIIDLRSAEDFSQGHIERSANVDLRNLYEYFKSNKLDKYQTVVIVDFTGEKAAFATSLMQLAGYKNVFSLDWGLSSWNIVFNKWDKLIDSSRSGQMVNNNVSKPLNLSLPSITTGKTNLEEIFDFRLNYILNQDFNGITINADMVFQSPGQFFIINYWPLEQYLSIGHIPGAINYVPMGDLLYSKNLKTLPLNKPIVVYEYTGQISGYIVAYLKLLGYDARILLYGTNGMIYNLMDSSSMPVWKSTYCRQYPFVN